MATRPDLKEAVAGTKSKASDYNENFDKMMDFVDASVTEAKDYVTDNVDDKAEIAPKIESLSGTTPSLVDNSVHKIEISGTTSFSLPTVDSSSKFHQMLVLLTMPEDEESETSGEAKYSIDSLGTTHYFYDTEPTMSSSGEYTLIYEYDGSNWVVGVMDKG